ncbi:MULTISPECIES: hypothetical protein [unclassified Streptomyces]|uniref:hypothetical protein n=1 Tax=unclassified Streptomyces TaxID=2593676 RepID=UPI000C272EBF|nr:hypothetical protein [Streptomyces sp. CB01373]PJM92720.1 hypothetical protein CG719_27535 [Streptomyces sp. CB01373]
MNRKRTTVAALAAAGVLTAAQLGLAGAASAATAAPQSSGCPIDIVYPSRFYVDHNGWVTNGGLYFGIKSKTTKKIKNVTFTVTNVKNVRFSTATPKGGKISRRTSQVVTVRTTTFKGKASLGFKVRTHLLNTRSYKVKFALHGSGWNCAVNQGTWGA